MSNRNVVFVDVSNAWLSKSGKLIGEGQKVDPKELPRLTRFLSWLFFSSRGEWRVQGGEPKFGLWEQKEQTHQIPTYREPEELMIDQEVGFSILNEASAYAAARAEVEERAKPPTSSKVCDGCGGSLVGQWMDGNAECYDRKDGWIGHRHKLTSCRDETERQANARVEVPLNAFVKDIVKDFGHATITWGEESDGGTQGFGPM